MDKKNNERPRAARDLKWNFSKCAKNSSIVTYTQESVPFAFRNEEIMRIRPQQAHEEVPALKAELWVALQAAGIPSTALVGVPSASVHGCQDLAVSRT